MKNCEGITKDKCASGCSERGCIITETGSGICAHPCKGGLQYVDKLRPEILAVYSRACEIVGKKNIHEVTQ